MRKTFRMRRLTAFVPVVVLGLLVAATMARPAAGQTATAGSPIVVEGTVAMVVEDDFQNGRPIKHYFLDRPGSHGRLDLKLTPNQAKAVHPGMQVRIMGSLAGRVLTSDAGDHALVVLEAPDTATAAPLAARKVLVLLVDITDANLVTHSVGATCDGSSDAAAASTFGFNTTAASVDGCERRQH